MLGRLDEMTTRQLDDFRFEGSATFDILFFVVHDSFLNFIR